MSRFAERPVDTTPTKKAKTNQNKIIIGESLYTYQDNARMGEPTGRGGVDITHPKKANAEMEKHIKPVDLANAYRYRPHALSSHVRSFTDACRSVVWHSMQVCRQGWRPQNAHPKHRSAR